MVSFDGVDISHPDIDYRNRKFYCKSPEALEHLKTQLSEIGYQLIDLREKDSRNSRRSKSIAELETSGDAVWFVKIDVKRHKCASCQSYIDMRGIMSHGHTCEVCGEITYLEVIDGSRVRFQFKDADDQQSLFGTQLLMLAKRWDKENSLLYLYPEPQSGGFLVTSGDEADEYLQQHKTKWEMVVEDGQKLLKVRYVEGMMNSDNDVINVIEIFDHHYNFSAIRVWKGKEYPDYGDFPVPETLHIYESWRWDS